MEEHKTFKGFNDGKGLLPRSHKFNMLEGKKYQLCCLKVGKGHLIIEFLYQRKWDFVMNVMIKEFVIGVIIKLIKIKISKLI